MRERGDRWGGAELGGLAGETRRLDDAWEGWSGRVVHPDSPLGAGGPGFFRAAYPAGAIAPKTPGHVHFREMDIIPVQAPVRVPRPANPPPATRPRVLRTSKRVQSALIDVDIEAEVLADNRSGPAGGAHTRVEFPRWTAPRHARPVDGNVPEFRGKFRWRGRITIQTQYGAGATARSVSCYGRGTTTSDVNARDITLGFHESCHQQDYVAYLSAHPLPEPPALQLGMPVADDEAEVQRFRRELGAYNAGLTQDSRARTDEVGHARSEVASRGCYVHHVP